MNHHYRDITDKLGTPQWWDEQAVPRYCPFTPDEGANIYAREIALLLIECQSCQQTFSVAMSTSSMDIALGRRSLRDLITAQEIHYGDPPNFGCCPAGPTMNSTPLRVLEFWDRGPASPVRVPDLEGEVA